MTSLSLIEAPTAMPTEARERWTTSADPEPRVGDLWLLGWDGSALGLVVLTKVIDDYVLAYPVTLPTDAHFAPAVLRDKTPLGAPLAIWPNLETGLGRHLLHRNFGNLLSQRTLQLIRAYAEDGTDSPLPISSGDYYADGNSDRFSELAGKMQALCFHTWPASEDGDLVLSSDMLTNMQANIAFMVETLGVAVPRAGELLRREAAPTADEVQKLAAAWHVTPDEVVAAGENEGATVLTHPAFKALIEQVMAKSGDDEPTVRRRAQSEYTLAARTSNLRDRQARMEAALRRLLND